MGFYGNVIFPRMIDTMMSTGLFSKQRALVLRDVQGDTLEIGFGTGLNLPFYPDHVKKLTVIDPNAGMKTLAERRIAASPIEVDRRVLGGEELPMEDASFDTVVCTWTMCSIPEVDRALLEVKRVLRPGGRFVFVEHGLSDKEAPRKWQNRVNGVWKRIGDGCNLNRPIDELVTASGLELAEIERFDMPKTPKFMGHTYRGTAVKSGA